MTTGGEQTSAIASSALEPLASAVEASWPLTGVAIGDALPSHPSRQVFRVESDQGSFVAKIHGAPRRHPVDADQLSVLDYLATRGFPHAPALLRTRHGGRVAQTPAGTCAILEWIPGPVDERSTSTWRDLGEAAGRLNGYLDFPMPFAIPIRATLDDLARRVAGTRIEAPFLRLLERAARVERLLPNGLVHGEINAANSRRRADGTVTLVDWDQAGTAPCALEYGYPLIAVFLSEGDLVFDDGSASMFYAAYVEAAGVGELPNAFDAALFHALRYMWWGDTERRWERIVHAVGREAELCSVIA